MLEKLCNDQDQTAQRMQIAGQVTVIGGISGIIAYKTISPKNKKRALYSGLVGIAGGLLGRVIINQPAFQNQVCRYNPILSSYKEIG